jgi:hypothetical protein
MKRVLLFFLPLVAAACMPVSTRGVVAMKVDESIVHLCLGSGETEKGDKLVVYRNDCRTGTAKSKLSIPTTPPCVKRVIGEGVVTEVLNEHYSVARLRTSTSVREGDVVELASRVSRASEPADTASRGGAE